MEHVGIGEDWHVGYRPRAEADDWKGRDPLCVNRALAERLAPAIAREIDDAVAFAAASAWPGPDALLSDVA
jgi:TPP-dependent pyruvate/acetoin dehydrogenase alpha subunit